MKSPMFALIAALIAAPAVADAHPVAAPKHGHPMAAMADTAANPYASGMAAMHERMMAAVGADASETFMRQMIEHHRGAIAMSRTALTASRDAEVRSLSQSIIRDQEREVAQMQAWLKRHGKRAQ